MGRAPAPSGGVTTIEAELVVRASTAPARPRTPGAAEA
jgi:hypothetical protein